MAKGPYLTFQIIPDGAAPSFSVRLPVWLIKSIIVLFALGIFFSIFVFFSLSKLNTKALLSDYYYHQNQQLLTEQKKLDTLQTQLLHISEKSKRVEEILQAYFPSNADKPSLEPPSEIDKMMITSEQLSDYVKEVDSLQKIAAITKKLDPEYIPNIWPARGMLTRTYSEEHKAIDIAGNVNQIVVATAKGIIFRAGWETELGNQIVIRHGGKYTTVYGHLNRMYVDVGDFVEKGTAIGSVGSTGKSIGTHLHYEIYRNDISLDPLTFLRH